jgi:hypothetical protein
MMAHKEHVVRTYYTAQDVVDFLAETPGATLVVEYDTETLLIQNHGLENLELRVDEDVDPDDVFQTMAEKLGFCIHFT